MGLLTDSVSLLHWSQGACGFPDKLKPMAFKEIEKQMIENQVCQKIPEFWRRKWSYTMKMSNHMWKKPSGLSNVCLDLRGLGAVGHICFIAAESQNSLQERTRLFIGQSPTALDYTALALRLAARGEHGFKPGCICCASYPGTYSKQGQARSSYSLK